MEKRNTDNRKKALCLSDSGIVELDGMIFRANHGCLESEKKEGNIFKVDLRYECNISQSTRSDKLEDTIDYGTVYKLVREEMDKPSNLIENVCARIFESISKAFPEITGLQVRVSKKNPPVDGQVEWASVTCKSE